MQTPTRFLLGLWAAFQLIAPWRCLAKGDQSRNSSQATSHPYQDMRLIPEGTFTMGCLRCGLEDALPVHTVFISSFWMDATPVTHAAFQVFVEKTGYKTIAERPPRGADFPTVPKEKLVPGSAVFTPPAAVASLTNALDWWRYVPGANWRNPKGTLARIQDRSQHPVVHIAYSDAVAYCQWAGKRLPSEAEFEYAARGGLVGKRYAWGDELKPGGHFAANIFQGFFPVHNSAEDGYTGTSPVRAFPANGYGLYDMGGNVWQWTADWYRPDTYSRDAAQGLVRDPGGPGSSYDPTEPGTPKRVQRGGSFLCSDRYCTRYLVGSRGKGAVDSAGSNTGFRCVKSKS